MKLTTCWRAGSLLKIPILLHWSLPVPLTLLTLTGIISQGWEKGTLPLLVVPIVIAIVTLHELGHCTTAKILRIPVKSITLTGIGAIAIIKPRPKEPPIRKLLVTLSGPLVNLLLPIPAICIWGMPTTQWLQLAQRGLPQDPWPAIYSLIMAINLAILLFNLLPIYPLDGGRILKEGAEIFFGKKAGKPLAIATCLIAGLPITLLLAITQNYFLASITLSVTIIGIIESHPKTQA
jgi:Zn-dependent protease